MPTNDDRSCLVDTSVAVAYVCRSHEHHRTCRAALVGRVKGLAGHAAFETFSVLTRLPGGLRLSASAAVRVLHADFPRTYFLDAEAQRTLLEDLARHSVTGGSVYDALVATTARVHGLPLVTADQRAAATYEQVGVEVELVS